MHWSLCQGPQFESGNSQKTINGGDTVQLLMSNIKLISRQLEKKLFQGK